MTSYHETLQYVSKFIFLTSVKIISKSLNGKDVLIWLRLTTSLS